MPTCLIVNFFRCDSAKCLGNKLVVANGQTFRHTPTATTNKNGAIGIKIFQKSNKPIVGKNNKQVKIIAPINHTTICAMRQIKMERGDKSAPDLKSNCKDVDIKKLQA